MIIVLRLNHRIKRDERLSTHVALVARAFKADEVLYSGQKDNSLESSINNIVKQWGNSFTIGHIKDTKKYLSDNKNNFKIINLTMYGLDFLKETKKLRKFKNLIILVGSEKVPIEYYKIADYNISITNQPHSEAAALAIFLYEYFGGKINKNFTNAKSKIIPNKDSKKVIKS